MDNYQVEIMLTLALVTGGYALALALHISGPIAVVVAGLMIGNQGRLLAMGDLTREHLDTFWELIDEILNAVLFVLIGLEVLVISFNGELVLMGLIAVVIVLFVITSYSIHYTKLYDERASATEIPPRRPPQVRIFTTCGLNSR